MTISIAIIDVIGIPFDGSTLDKRGLGGSESAVCLMSKELVKLGFDVTVFNNCIYDDASEGIYDGVKYIGLNRIKDHDCKFDIVISSRTVVPFIKPEQYAGFTNLLYNFEKIKANAKYKAVWMHDTFCVGDHLLEELLVEGHIDEIFTLSDFHTSYVLNCDHGGRKRMFEVLKNKTFITRNGIKRWIDQVDIKSKDPDLFIYNASVTKGMMPLIKGVWPAVKQNIPNAKLKIIGGYYRFRKDMPPDEQEKTWHELVKEHDGKLGVEFTGVISQKDIAEICAKATFMLYPTAFPETFGISSLEALNYNTPLITCRFGALEEIATDFSSYLIDYPAEGNSLFPHINTEHQIRRFIDLTLRAYNDKYLLQQKQNYCDVLKDISGWDTVALQWKQHFYKRFGLPLPIEEYKKVSKLNYELHRVFDRRFMNREEQQLSFASPEQKIIVVSPLYNAEKYIADCIQSVASQNYSNYEHYIVNDASTDNSLTAIKQTIAGLDPKIRHRFKIINNIDNLGAVCNTVTTIRGVPDADIVMIVDGDDKLAPRNDIFRWYNELYDGSVDFTYGSCWSMVDNIPLIAQDYPNDIRLSRQFRKYKFNWGMPYTHLRTFTRKLIDYVDDAEFMNAEGQWYRAGGDNAVFYALIEQADPTKVKAVKHIHYYYNDTNPSNDYKINQTEQTKTANEIVNRPIQELKDRTIEQASVELKLETVDSLPTTNIAPTLNTKRILAAIPTAKNIEVETFKSIFDQVVPANHKLEFQYFYGYNIDQVRNLIAHWTIINGFDYLLSVDSDIVLPTDALGKMLTADKDIVSGIYIQRKHDVKIPEIYLKNQHGGVTNAPLAMLQHNNLMEIDGCGFGCALIKTNVLKDIGYPQFVYHDTLDFQYTVSEDVDFCRKAKDKGFRIFADCSIRCEHIGSHKFTV